MSDPSAPPPERECILQYIKIVKEHSDLDANLKRLRAELKKVNEKFDKTEEDLKALQSVGQIIGQVLRKISNDKFIVKASSGPRYVVGCKVNIDTSTLVCGTRVALDMTTLTIMRSLPREVDPTIFNMLNEVDMVDGKQRVVEYNEIGGLDKQIREMREVIELPLRNPYLFQRVGIKPPKGILLYGPPGTGKTLLARAMASNINCNFLKVVASAIVDKYIGESARIIREMFGYAKDHQPCIIFMDEIDAIGGKRFSHGTSADREIQRTLMELLNHLDGFNELGQVKIIMATNRPDVLDPALIRPGRLDRKIEIPLPNEAARIDILKIHASKLNVQGTVDYDAICRLCDGFNGADMRNICTEAGMLAIRAMRDFVVKEDFIKAARKIGESKKLEGNMNYENGATDLKAPIMLLTGHTGELFTLSFSPNGKHLASSGLDREIYCENFAVLSGHKNAVIELHWSLDNDFIFSASADETLGLWDVEYRKRVKKFVGHSGIVNGCYPCGERCVVSASDDGCIKLWDIRTKKQVNSLQHDFQILSICADIAGEYIYSGSLDNIIRVYDSRTFKQVMQLTGHRDSVTSVHLNNSGMDQSIIIWDVQPFCENPTRIESKLTGPTHNFENNLIKTRWGKGTLLASGSADRNVYVFDTLGSKLLYKLGGHSGSVNDIALHPHQPILASCSSDKTIYLGELV